MKKLFTLLLVLACYVGTASAWTTVKLLNSVEKKWDNNATTEMIKINDGSSNYFYYILDSSTITDENGNYYFRIYVSDDEKYYGAWENDFSILDYTNYGGKESTYSFKLVTDKSSKYIISVGYWDKTWHFTATTYNGIGTITFVNTKDFTAPYVYAYCTGDAKLTGGWPGMPMTQNADGTWSLSNVNIGKESKLIISDTSKGNNQLYKNNEPSFSGDIVLDGNGAVENQTLTLNTYGMATYCSAYPLDFSSVSSSGLSAYRISSAANGNLTKEALAKVPAGVGVYVEGTANEEYTIPTTATATAIGTNMLVGVTTDTPISQTDGANTNFILTVNAVGGDVATPKFFKVNSEGNKVLANRAYLQIPTAYVNAREFFWFVDETEENETTGINAVNGTISNGATIYNLAGQKVSNDYKGIVIVNGKKIIRK